MTVTKQTREVEMNADKMTREEFVSWVSPFIPPGDAVRYNRKMDALWDRFNAIQSAPFVPDWSLKPSGCTGYVGFFTGASEDAWASKPGHFFIPVPSNPSDAELSAMWEKLDRDKRVQILKDAGAMK